MKMVEGYFLRYSFVVFYFVKLGIRSLAVRTWNISFPSLFRQFNIIYVFNVIGHAGVCQKPGKVMILREVEGGGVMV